MVTGAAQVAGVVGWPVAHSRSPRLHGHWLARYGIDGAYVPLAVPPGKLPDAVRGLQAAGFRGLNVTLPHKVPVMDLCDRIDDPARRSGAVNTLVFGPDGIEGRNTDGIGFLASLVARLGTVPAGPVLIVGAGGGARAIAATLLDAGYAVTVCNRSADRAAALKAVLPEVGILPWVQRAAALGGFQLLVNTTQLGMAGQPALDLSLDRADAGLIAADIVYTPMQTPLLEAAGARGLRTVGGIGMLLHQAAPGFAAWFGVVPVVDQALQDAVLG